MRCNFFNKHKVQLIFFFFAFLLAWQTTFAQKPPAGIARIIFFHSRACHKCIQTIREFMPAIERMFKGRVGIDYRDLYEIENYKLYLGLGERYQHKVTGELPVVFLNGKFLVGQADVKKNLVPLIEQALAKGVIRQEGGVLKADLLERFRSFTPWAIIGYGLIDGINPCAFTVLVFFISFLTLQGYRRKDLLAIGLVFIFAVFLTYMLLGLGILGFFYLLRGFWIFAKIINYSVGLLSIGLGMAALYDFLEFKKTGSSEGMLLQLPPSIKKQIHSVIGMHYRTSGQDAQKKTAVRYSARLLASSLIAGFLVSLLEAVCTGQVYLPTVTFVLKASAFKLQALGYLLLYNFMFILPLLLILFLALLGRSSAQFSGILKRHMLAIKFLMVILFFSLGVFLLWRG